MFFRKLAWLLRRRRREADLDAEIRFHVEQTAEDLRDEGAPPDEAARAALRDLGNAGRVLEDTRATWTWNWFEQLGQDARYALRAMRHNPVFTAMAVLSLALGIGANTAIASFLDALMLRSLPIAGPHRLAVLNWHNAVEGNTVFHGGSGSVYDDPQYGHSARIFPYPALEMFARSQTVFSSLFGYLPARNLDVVIRGQAEVDAGEYVSGDYFQGLDLAPAAGRLLSSDDDRAGAAPAVVLSYGFSQSRFGSPDAAVGQSILINNVAFTVAGVTRPGFDGIDPSFAARFFLPVHANLLLDPIRFGQGSRRYLDANSYWIELMGRLRPGVTRAQAEAQLAAQFHAWVETTATKDAERSRLPTLHLTDGATGIDTLRRRYSQPFYLLWGMVGLILAIACANIANLLLARAASRRAEMAVRLGIGAGRGRVIRQLLTESVVLALAGGGLGVWFAFGGIRLLSLALGSSNEPFPIRAELNWPIFAAAAALSIVTGLLFGLAPAFEATRVDVIPALRGGRAEEHRRGCFRLTLSQALITVQIALSALLLVGAGLFVRTLSNLQSIQLGFNRENILLFKINARQAGHRDPEITNFYSDLQERFAAIPGVRGAVVSNSPLVGDGTWSSPVAPMGKPIPYDEPDGHGRLGSGPATHILTIGPGFFATMQIPLLAGREFNEHDRLDSLPVAIVNQEWARANFGDQNPVGQQIVMDTNGKRAQMEVVGLAKNSLYGDLRDRMPRIVYMAFAQNLYRPPEEATYALRAMGDPLALAASVREIVRQADSRVPVTGLQTQVAMIDQNMTGATMFARLCSGFALLALAIACVGLYGTIAHTVARRTGEIGIRIALGASQPGVVWLVMRQVAATAAVGLFVGIGAALGLSRLAGFLLFGVKPADPAAIGLAVVALLAAAGGAAFLPAKRAAGIQPVVALRHE